MRGRGYQTPDWGCQPLARSIMDDHEPALGVRHTGHVGLSPQAVAFHCWWFSVPLQTNGNSNGLVPMLRVYNNTARYVDQGGNKVLALN